MRSSTCWRTSTPRRISIASVLLGRQLASELVQRGQDAAVGEVDADPAVDVGEDRHVVGRDVGLVVGLLAAAVVREPAVEDRAGCRGGWRGSCCARRARSRTGSRRPARPGGSTAARRGRRSRCAWPAPPPTSCRARAARRRAAPPAARAPSGGRTSCSTPGARSATASTQNMRSHLVDRVLVDREAAHHHQPAAGDQLVVDLARGTVDVGMADVLAPDVVPRQVAHPRRGSPRARRRSPA